MSEESHGFWRDRTWCASPKCENKCGCKMPEELIKKIGQWDRISYSYFCGELTNG